MCYPGDPRGPAEPSDAPPLTDKPIDAQTEISRIRHSLSLLESAITRPSAAAASAASTNWPANGLSPSLASLTFAPSSTADHSSRQQPLQQRQAPEELPATALAQLRTGNSGLFAGATSPAVTLLAVVHPSDDDLTPEEPRREPDIELFDLLPLLPTATAVESFLQHYFESCQWEYRFLHYPSFYAAWARVRSSGANPGVLILAIIFLVIAIVIQHLPPSHTLLKALPEAPVSDVADKYFTAALESLSREQRTRHHYSLELIEVLLLKAHYFAITKDCGEESWMTRGELVSIGIAMGLHRDPANWRFPSDIAERRRWAWWNIMLIERFHAFIFGRPLAIPSDQFDTRLPGPLDHTVDPTGRQHLPQLHLFRLTDIIGNLVSDALSLHPVPYSRILARDAALEQWLTSLPAELEFDEFHLGQALQSPALPTRREAHQSLSIRLFFYHVRVALHRPYAFAPLTNTATLPFPRSLETAFSTAVKLIQLASQARPDFLANPALAVPGHLHWGPVHLLAGAMFCITDLILYPELPHSGQCKQEIKRARVVLDHLNSVKVAERALRILRKFDSIIDDDAGGEGGDSDGGESRAPAQGRRIERIIEYARHLAFPFHDKPGVPHAAFGPRTSSGGSPSPPVTTPASSTPVSQRPAPYGPLTTPSAGYHSHSSHGTVTEDPGAVWGVGVGVESVHGDWTFMGSGHPPRGPGGPGGMMH